MKTPENVTPAPVGSGHLVLPPASGPYAFITSQDMLRAAEICAKAAHDPLNRGEIASILLGASRILTNTSLRPSVQNVAGQPMPAENQKPQ
jgi:hypothetical protein